MVKACFFTDSTWKYVNKILTDLKFVIDHTQGKTQQQIEADDLLVDSIMFRVIQIAEKEHEVR